jgi:hypothetical protein
VTNAFIATYLVADIADALDLWRDESVHVRECYARWLCASRSDSGLAYTAYASALDGEELAAAHFEDAVRRLERNGG